MHDAFKQFVEKSPVDISDVIGDFCNGEVGCGKQTAAQFDAVFLQV